MASRDRERRDMEIETYERRLTEHSGGNRPSLSLPPGLRMFNSSKPPFNLDFLPYRVTERGLKFTKNFARVGKAYPERTFFTHRNVGPNDDTYTCPLATFNNPCPICQFRTRYTRSPKPEDVETAKNLKPSQRQIFLVYDRDNPNTGVLLWDVAYTLFGEGLDAKINNASERKKARYFAYFDPDDGFTLRIIGKEKKMPKGKPINEFVIDEFAERESPVPEDVINHGFCLDTIVREPTFDELKKVFFGGDPDDHDRDRSDSRADSRDTTRDRDRDADRRDDRDDDRRRDTRREERDERPSRNGDSGRDTRRDNDRDDDRRGGSAWERSVGTDIGGRPMRDETRAEKPARDAYVPAVGDSVRFNYRDSEFEGAVVELNEKEQICRVEYEGGRFRWVDYEECALLDARPKRRGRDDDDDKPARGRDKEESDDRPPARTSSGGGKTGAKDDDEKTTKSSGRGGAKGRGWEDDDKDEKPARAGKKDDKDEKPARGTRK